MEVVPPNGEVILRYTRMCKCNPRKKNRTGVAICFAAWTLNLQLFLDPVSTVYALVLKANKKELDDKKL